MPTQGERSEPWGSKRAVSPTYANQGERSEPWDTPKKSNYEKECYKQLQQASRFHEAPRQERRTNPLKRRPVMQTVDINLKYVVNPAIMS